MELFGSVNLGFTTNLENFQPLFLQIFSYPILSYFSFWNCSYTCGRLFRVVLQVWCSFSYSVFFSLLQVGSFLSVYLQIHWLFTFLHSVSSSNAFLKNIYIFFSSRTSSLFSFVVSFSLPQLPIYLIYSFRPLSIIMIVLKNSSLFIVTSGLSWDHYWLSFFLEVGLHLALFLYT